MSEAPPKNSEFTGIEKPVCYLDEQLNVVELKPDGSTGDALASDDVAVKAIHDMWSKQREELLALPSDEEGLNMERVDDYRKKMGAAKKVIKVLSTDDFLAARGPSPQVDLYGKNFPTLDIAIVNRDSAVEREYGPGFTESLIVHEMVHASIVPPSIFAEIERKQRLFRPDKLYFNYVAIDRTGFMRPQKGRYPGSFIEEGYAEYERGRYITDVLGMPDGFFPQYPPDTKDRMFNKYCMPPMEVDGKVETRATPGIFSGVTIDLLIQHDPGLLDAMRKSRTTPEALQEVEERINSVEPGLYQAMDMIDVYAADWIDKSLPIFARVARLVGLI